VRSTEDLKKYFEGATALTPQGTLLEKELIQLRDKYQLHFNIEYTTNHELLKVIRNRKKAIGFLNLPIYLMDLKKGLTKLNRQNYLTKRYEGRGIGLTKTSDWDEPLKEYFASTQFKQNIELIMGHYFNIDLFHFIETFSPENEVGLLTEEKDLQRLQLQLQQVEIRDKNEKQVYLIAIISIVSILLLVIAFLFKKQRETNHLLQEQKAEIETQSEHIKAINNNLELMILERTRQLENKNKALEEYAFITAHKLRGPLTSIMGLVMLTEKIKLPEEDKIIISHLHQSAKQLDEIVHSAMNAIDKSDSLKQDKSA
jgi:signal transduction histidine kinase